MRCSGILMHITSLPGPYGVGAMGKQAFSFVDFLEAAGQKYWQILPLNPTGYGDSPYQSCSTFAGNHYLIDLDTLLEEGLLERADLEGIEWCRREDKVDFGLLYDNRLKVLRKAYSRFRGGDAFEAFLAENVSWLPDFGLYMALKDRFGGKPWYEWEDGLKFRDPATIAGCREELADEIRFYGFVQFLFLGQWNALRGYAHSKGIRIIGDVPIYVPYDSVDVWTNTALFALDDRLRPVEVAGCPPDAFSAEGQLWGNPLYRWDRMAAEGYRWWLARMSAAGQWYDTVRLDHFRGFEAYWAIPYGDPDARGGHWVKGPDMDFVSALKKGLPELDIIAEDLGYLTREVRQLRDGSGWPGMKILEFAFDLREPANYLPHTYTKNTVCYTGTHDNMTMRQWFDTADADSRRYAMEYMNLSDEKAAVWGAIRTAYATVSDTVIIQMQDFLDLGAAGRMNFPGTLTDLNWTWRAKDGIIGERLAEKIRNLTEIYCRTGNEEE
ncbi:MAG: 4-alpha-glucanotransferase [Oscillospiraceae bacterium]|nr:4-alpha-glucanotransferase [Oscillospiraceae bacterium]